MSTKYFYRSGQRVTHIEGEGGRNFFKVRGTALAEVVVDNGLRYVACLAVDVGNSIHCHGASEVVYSYSPFGYMEDNGKSSVLAFHGDCKDMISEAYLLGNGYRLYNSSLKRFCSPDKQSPFGKGSFNGYAYCQGDPVNYADPSGANRVWQFFINAYYDAKDVLGFKTPFHGARNIKDHQALALYKRYTYSGVDDLNGFELDKLRQVLTLADKRRLTQNVLAFLDSRSLSIPSGRGLAMSDQLVLDPVEAGRNRYSVVRAAVGQGAFSDDDVQHRSNWRTKAERDKDGLDSLVIRLRKDYQDILNLYREEGELAGDNHRDVVYLKYRQQ